MIDFWKQEKENGNIWLWIIALLIATLMAPLMVFVIMPLID
jgi:hypothetical protein